MDDVPKGPAKKALNHRRYFRLWRILAAIIFLALLIATQFLPGGTRSFEDGVQPVVFLFWVSLAVATVIVGPWAMARWVGHRFGFKQSLCVGALSLVLIVLFYAVVRGWITWTRFEHQWEAKAEHFDLAGAAPLAAPADSNLVKTPAGVSEAQVSVDTANVVRTVDARLFGVNAPFWDSLLDTPGTISALREMDAHVLRFGEFFDDYHWATGNFGTNGTAPISFTNFAHVVTNLHARAIITVNYGTGTPEEAAAWVRFANITNHYGFKYWIIGNEIYLNLEHDENWPPYDPVLYATRASDYIRRMKAADPTIKVGVGVLPSWTWLARVGVVYDALRDAGFGQFIREGYLGWTPEVLATMKQLGTMPDFVEFHSYPVIAPGWERDASLLQSTAHWSAEAAALRRQLKTYFGDANTNVELLCTELNSNPAFSAGKQTTSMVNGLYLADSFGQIAQTEFNSFLWWDLRNSQDKNNNNSPALYGWRQYGDFGMMFGNDTRYPTFYTFKLLKYFARGGDRIVRAASNNKLLSVYAARRTGGALTMLVINKSPDASIEAS